MLKKIGCFIILLCCIMSAGCSNYFAPKGKTIYNISWIDFIQFNDIKYYSSMDSNGLKLTKDDLDKELYKVKFNVVDNVQEPGYKIKNGDAAFLPVNTEVYSVKGYSNNFCLAAYNSRRELVVYFADVNPKAKKGEDLLDIKDKVESISINSEMDGKELASITDEKLIGKMVDMILQASVDTKQRNSSKRFFIEFHLKRGISFKRCYFIDAGELGRGIMLPKEFTEIIQKAVAGKE